MDNEKKKEISDNLSAANLSTTKDSICDPMNIDSIDLEQMIQPKNYQSAIDFITAQSGKLNAITNQINFLTGPAYQPNILTAITGVQNCLSTFSTIQTYLPNVDHLSAISPMLDLSRQATLAISGLTTPSVMTGLAASVDKNYQPWYETNIGKYSILSVKTNSELNLAGKSQNAAVTIDAQNLSTLILQSSIVKATEFSLFAEKSLFALNLQNIGVRIKLAPEPKKYLTTSFVELSNSYSTLLKSFESNPLSYTQISPTISRIAPLEYFSTAKLIEAISVEEDITPEEELLKNEIQYENEILLSSHLPRIDSGLYKMWKGAIEAYNSNNSDKIRHFSTSIRELFTHLLHILAPDDDVRKWSSDTTHYFERRPTRKARLLFICRNINNDSFNTFVKKDVDATMAFFEIFQKGTHAIDPVFSPNHLVTIKSKAENTLKFLLEIHFTTNN